MVGHQAVAKDGETMGLCVLPETGEVDPAIVVTEEDLLPIVATLRNVVRHSRDCDSGDSRHVVDLTQFPAARKQEDSRN